VLLRTSMIEPLEFVTSKRQHVLQRVAAKAAARVADTFSTQRTYSGRLMTRRQIRQQLRTITKVVLSPRSSVHDDDVDSIPINNTSEHEDEDDAYIVADAAINALEEGPAAARMEGNSNAGTVCSSRVHERVSEGGSIRCRSVRGSVGGAGTCNAVTPAELPVSARPSEAGSDAAAAAAEQEEDHAQQLPATTTAAAAAGAFKRCMTADTDRAIAGSERAPGTPCTPFSPFSLQQPISPQAAAAAAAADNSRPAELKLWLDECNVVADIGCEVQYVAQLELAGSKIKRHVPLAVLGRQHKQLLWLQFFLESSYAATFYIFTG
jgi:hypothetical protein